MQIRNICLLLFFTGVMLGASSPENLFPEWQTSAGNKNLLPQWRFTEWGSRFSGKKPLKRTHTLSEKQGMVQVTLENPAEGRSVNMLHRTFVLNGKEQKIFRFSIKGVSASPEKALLHLKLTAPGTPVLVKEKFFTVTEVPALYTIELKIPSTRKALAVQLSFCSPGKVTLSEGSLTAHPPEETLFSQIRLPEGTFLLPERTPVLLPLRLPAASASESPLRLHLTLPWGVRFVNSSAGTTLQAVNVKVRQHTEYLLRLPKRTPVPFYLLLASDLAASDTLHSGVIRWENDKEKSEKHFFRLQTVKDLPVLPPRTFKIILDGTEKADPRELRADWDTALLRSGANVLNAEYLSIPPRTLRNARISQFAALHFPQAKAANACAYEPLRNESFWEKYFLPTLRRHLLRRGTSQVSALLCDSFLGQRRSIECLCALCRAELADFAPRLPRRGVMNYSRGLLVARYAKEVQKFRLARLTALYEGARLQLPTGKNGFQRTPKIIPSYTFFQALQLTAPVLKTPEAVIQFGTGIPLPDGEVYNGAVNFLCYEYCRSHMMKLLPKCRLTAQLTVTPERMTPENVKFEMLNCFFAGFQGLRLIMAPEACFRYRKAVAETASFLREYENLFRSGKVTAHKWKLTSTPEHLDLPPVPGPGYSPLPTGSRTAPFRLKVWRSGDTTLIGIANLTSRSLPCRLSGGPGKPVTVNGTKYNGTVPLSRGIEITVPEYSWKFLTVKE